MSDGSVRDIHTGQELPSSGRNGNGGGGPGERLARIEEKLASIKEYGATKDDITKVKLWFLGGMLAAVGLAVPAAIGVAYAFARLFSGP